MPRSGAIRLDALPKRQAEFIQPMECALVPTLPEGPDWTYEVKLDGYRAIGVKTSRETILYSRNHKIQQTIPADRGGACCTLGLTASRIEMTYASKKD